MQLSGIRAPGGACEHNARSRAARGRFRAALAGNRARLVRTLLLACIAATGAALDASDVRAAESAQLTSLELSHSAISPNGDARADTTDASFHVSASSVVKGTVYDASGQQVLDHWNDHAALDDSGTILLEAGRRYEIRLEYYENGGGAVIKLAWASPSMPRVIVPSSALRTPGIVAAAVEEAPVEADAIA